MKLWSVIVHDKRTGKDYPKKFMLNKFKATLHFCELAKREINLPNKKRHLEIYLT